MLGVLLDLVDEDEESESRKGGLSWRTAFGAAFLGKSEEPLLESTLVIWLGSQHTRF